MPPQLICGLISTEVSPLVLFQIYTQENIKTCCKD